MKVKEMTISDVHQTVVFKNELGRLLSELDYIRKDAIGLKVAGYVRILLIGSKMMAFGIRQNL